VCECVFVCVYVYKEGWLVCGVCMCERLPECVHSIQRDRGLLFFCVRGEGGRGYV